MPSSSSGLRDGGKAVPSGLCQPVSTVERPDRAPRTLVTGVQSQAWTVHFSLAPVVVGRMTVQAWQREWVVAVVRVVEVVHVLARDEVVIHHVPRVDPREPAEV